MFRPLLGGAGLKVQQCASLVLFLRGLAADEVLLSSNAMLVLFLRGLAADEVLLSSNAMLVLFLRGFAATNAMRG